MTILYTHVFSETINSNPPSGGSSIMKAITGIAFDTFGVGAMTIAISGEAIDDTVFNVQGQPDQIAVYIADPGAADVSSLAGIIAAGYIHAPRGSFTAEALKDYGAYGGTPDASPASFTGSGTAKTIYIANVYDASGTFFPDVRLRNYTVTIEGGATSATTIAYDAVSAAQFGGALHLPPRSR